MIDTRVINLSYDDVCKAIREYCTRHGKSVPHTAKVEIDRSGDGGFGATVEMPYVESSRSAESAP